MAQVSIISKLIIVLQMKGTVSEISFLIKLIRSFVRSSIQLVYCAVLESVVAWQGRRSIPPAMTVSKA